MCTCCIACLLYRMLYSCVCWLMRCCLLLLLSVWCASVAAAALWFRMVTASGACQRSSLGETHSNTSGYLKRCGQGGLLQQAVGRVCVSAPASDAEYTPSISLYRIPQRRCMQASHCVWRPVYCCEQQLFCRTAGSPNLLANWLEAAAAPAMLY